MCVRTYMRTYSSMYALYRYFVCFMYIFVYVLCAGMYARAFNNMLKDGTSVPLP